MIQQTTLTNLTYNRLRPITVMAATGTMVMVMAGEIETTVVTKMATATVEMAAMVKVAAAMVTVAEMAKVVAMVATAAEEEAIRLTLSNVDSI